MDAALAWLDDLRPLWEVELPERPEHAATRREYELRRAEATATAFERLGVLGPVVVEARVAEGLLAGRALAEAIAPERAVLHGDRAEVMAQLVGGRQPWIRRADTLTARRKRVRPSPAATSLNSTGEIRSPRWASSTPIGVDPGFGKEYSNGPSATAHCHHAGVLAEDDRPS